MTPAGNKHTVYDDLDEPPLNGNTNYALNPQTSNARFGSWIIGQSNNYFVNQPGTVLSTEGSWPWPAPFAYSYGRIVTVQPSWEDGGVVDPPYPAAKPAPPALQLKY
jgi:hypothetical protein